MSEHERMQTLLGARHDLSASERAALNAHLRSCAPCRELAQEYDAQDAFLRALPLPVPEPSLRRAVLARIESRPTGRFGSLQRGALFAVPALVTLLVIVLVAVHPGASSGPASCCPVFGTTHSSAAPAQNGAAQEQRTPILDRAAAVPTNPAYIEAAPLIPPVAKVAGTVMAGFRLTLTVPQTTYAKNALVRVEMEVENRTDMLVWVDTWVPYGCSAPGPYVEAIDRSGRHVDPLPGRPIPSCPAAVAGPGSPGFLRPGQTMRTHAYVVLLTDRLRAVATVTAYRGCDPRIRSACRGTATQIVGHPLAVSLRPSQAPRIALHGLPPASFSLVPVERRPVLLWYQGWYTCGPGPGQGWGMSEGGVGTVFRPSNSAPLRFFSDCSSKAFVLHLVAGHPGQPVAFITEQRGHVHP